MVKNNPRKLNPIEISHYMVVYTLQQSRYNRKRQHSYAVHKAWKCCKNEKKQQWNKSKVVRN